MSVSRKIGVLITKKYFSYDSLHLTIFLIQAKLKSFAKLIYAFFHKKNWPFHTKYIAKIRISKFSAKNYVCPDKTLKKDCHWPDVQRPHFTRIPKEMQELIQIPCKYLADPGQARDCSTTLGKNYFWRKTRKSFFLPYSWYGKPKFFF